MTTRNAIIMAAGMSTRFVPFCIEKPKGLLVVKGEVLIERQIKQLKEAGINDITLVTGYMADAFSYLENKYQIRIIYNKYYETRNNHSSLFVAKKYLKNTFICSADNYYEENVFLNEFDQATYASIFIEGKTDEWTFDVDDDLKILNVEVGGENKPIMLGFAYFNETFSNQLIPYLDETMESLVKANYFWENIYIDHISEMEMYIHLFNKNVIREFDSLEELREFDEYSATSIESKIMKELIDLHHCDINQIHSFVPVKNNGVVKGFTYEIGELTYRYEL